MTTLTDLGERRRQPDRDAARRRSSPACSGLTHGTGHAGRRLPQGRHRRRAPAAGITDRHDPVPRHGRPLHAQRRDAASPRSTPPRPPRRPNPAVTLRSVGTNGGQAAAFTYDLARRSSTPARAIPPGPARSATASRRSAPTTCSSAVRHDRLGQPRQGRDPAGRRAAAAAGQPDPDDEPRQEAAAALLVLPAQRSRRSSSAPATTTATAAPPAASTSTSANSPPGCSVADWTCPRFTSYVYPSTPLTNAQRRAPTTTRASRSALHARHRLRATSPRPASRQTYTHAARAVGAPSTRACPRPATNRYALHRLERLVGQPTTELANGMRLDTNYYYWPGSWIAEPAGLHDRLRHARCGSPTPTAR